MSLLDEHTPAELLRMAAGVGGGIALGIIGVPWPVIVIVSGWLLRKPIIDCWDRQVAAARRVREELTGEASAAPRLREYLDDERKD